MAENNVSYGQKALVYALLFDIATSALSTIGSVSSADKTKLAMIVFDTITSAAKSQKTE